MCEKAKLQNWTLDDLNVYFRPKPPTKKMKDMLILGEFPRVFLVWRIDFFKWEIQTKVSPNWFHNFGVNKNDCLRNTLTETYFGSNSIFVKNFEVMGYEFYILRWWIMHSISCKSTEAHAGHWLCVDSTVSRFPFFPHDHGFWKTREPGSLENLQPNKGRATEK